MNFMFLNLASDFQFHPFFFKFNVCFSFIKDLKFICFGGGFFDSVGVLLFAFVFVLCVCVHVCMLHCVHAYYLRRLERKSDDPELELLVSLTYHVDAENHT